jgi:hypothetical protein
VGVLFHALSDIVAETIQEAALVLALAMVGRARQSGD